MRSAAMARLDSLLPLTLDAVSFAAGGRTILADVDLVLERGSRTVIVGPNGAGKSVLMRLCHGLLQPTSGTIRWHDPEHPGEPRRQAMVFQRPVMLRRSVLANLAVRARHSSVSAWPTSPTGRHGCSRAASSSGSRSRAPG
jgi:tungstate transport system ATP-binding protein